MEVPAVARTLPFALLAACTFDADFATDYRCGVGDTCPEGSHCVGGRCTAGGEPTIDAAVDVPDAGDPPRFADDFGDGVLTGWSPWTHTGCTVTETGGALQLDFDGNGESYCGVDTVDTFDLRTGAVTVDLVEASTLANFEAYIDLFSPDTTQQIQMVLDSGALVMQLRIDGTVTSSSAMTDPGEHHWRIHLEGSTTYWETSADGATWQPRHSTTDAVDASVMRVELAAGHYLPGTGTPVRARFDDLVVE